MKIGDKVTTKTGHKGEIVEIAIIGDNKVITLKDRTRWLETEIKKKKKIKEI